MEHLLKVTTTMYYHTPVVRGNARPIEVEVSPLLSRHSSMSTVTGEREPTVGEHVRQQRGVVRALLLWLGIGQWYCKFNSPPHACELVNVCIYLQLDSAFSSVSCFSLVEL